MCEYFCDNKKRSLKIVHAIVICKYYFTLFFWVYIDQSKIEHPNK
jgi:hypothetical protein